MRNVSVRCRVHNFSRDHNEFEIEILMCTKQERLFLLYIIPHKYIYKGIKYICGLHRITRHLGIKRPVTVKITTLPESVRKSAYKKAGFQRYSEPRQKELRAEERNNSHAFGPEDRKAQCSEA